MFPHVFFFFFFFFSRSAFGVTIAGEWSNGFNDCGLFLIGVGISPSYAGSCSDWQDSSNWTAGTKAGLMAFASASMDTLGDWFFWTWKVSTGYFSVILCRGVFNLGYFNRLVNQQLESLNLPCGRTSWVFVEVGCLRTRGRL